MTALLNKAGAETGDVVLIVADTKKNSVLSVLGALRQEVAKKLDIIPTDKYNLLWITEFPFFEWDEEAQTFVAMHHPFTSPMDECLEYLETDKAQVRAKAYDLVLNGVELCSGSIRITNPDLQARIFSLLGLFAKVFVVDDLLDSMNMCKAFTIITTKANEINEYITSFTLLEGTPDSESLTVALLRQE